MRTPAGAPAAQEGKTFSLWDGQTVTITRRHFLYGAAALGAAALVGGGAYLNDVLNPSDEDDPVLAVSSEAVFSTDDCTLIEDADSAMRLVCSRKLPFGSLVFASSDSVATCLLPGESASPLVQVALLGLGSGSLSTVLKEAVGQGEGFEVLDARASENGLVWLEAHILKGLWRVYTAPLSGLELGAATLVDEGDASWQMPNVAATAASAFWQVVPLAGGPAEDEPSRLMRAPFAAPVAEEALSSSAPMATAPYSCGDGVVVTPRASLGNSYYQLTRVDGTTGEVTDSLVLPRSMKPIEVGYGDTGFSFAFDGIYDYGDGISNLGTYTPAALPGSGLVGTSSAAAYDSAEWFRFARTPVTAPAWCGRWFMVRSTNSVCGVDLSTREYFSLDLENGATDYGDQLATTGTGERVVTFSNVDYTPLNGEQEKHTLVRVWEAA